MTKLFSEHFDLQFHQQESQRFDITVDLAYQHSITYGSDSQLGVGYGGLGILGPT